MVLSVICIHPSRLLPHTGLAPCRAGAVLAISDVGIAMGGPGSDAAIEMAEVVILTDQPSRIVTAIQIGNDKCYRLALAFGVKIIVLALGAPGVASMWEGVFC